MSKSTGRRGVSWSRFGLIITTVDWPVKGNFGNWQGWRILPGVGRCGWVGYLIFSAQRGRAATEEYCPQI